MGGKTFMLFSSFFFFFRGVAKGGLDYSFCTLAKKRCNFLVCSLIALKFGKNKEHI